MPLHSLPLLYSSLFVCVSVCFCVFPDHLQSRDFKDLILYTHTDIHIYIYIYMYTYIYISHMYMYKYIYIYYIYIYVYTYVYAHVYIYIHISHMYMYKYIYIYISLSLSIAPLIFVEKASKTSDSPLGSSLGSAPSAVTAPRHFHWFPD